MYIYRENHLAWAHMYSLSHTHMHMIGSGIYNWILGGKFASCKKRNDGLRRFESLLSFFFFLSRAFPSLSLSLSLISILAFKDEIHDL